MPVSHNPSSQPSWGNFLLHFSRTLFHRLLNVRLADTCRWPELLYGCFMYFKVEHRDLVVETMRSSQITACLANSQVLVACYYGTSLWRTVVGAQKVVNPWEANKPKSYSRNKRQSCPRTRCPSTTEWPVVNFAPRIARAGDVNTVNESTGSGNRCKSHNNYPICSYNGKGCIPLTNWS